MAGSTAAQDAWFNDFFQGQLAVSPPTEVAFDPGEAGDSGGGPPAKGHGAFPDARNAHGTEKDVHDLNVLTRDHLGTQKQITLTLVNDRFDARYKKASDDAIAKYKQIVQAQKEREEYIENILFTLPFFLGSTVAVASLAKLTQVGFALGKDEMAVLLKTVKWDAVKKVADAAAQDGKKLMTKQAFKAGTTIATTMLSLATAIGNQLIPAKQAIMTAVAKASTIQEVAGIHAMMQANDYHTFSTGLDDYLDRYEKQIAPIVTKTMPVVLSSAEDSVTTTLTPVPAIIYLGRGEVYYAQVTKCATIGPFLSMESYEFERWIGADLVDEIPNFLNAVKLTPDKEPKVSRLPSGKPPPTARAHF